METKRETINRILSLPDDDQNVLYAEWRTLRSGNKEDYDRYYAIGRNLDRDVIASNIYWFARLHDDWIGEKLVISPT